MKENSRDVKKERDCEQDNRYNGMDCTVYTATTGLTAAIVVLRTMLENYSLLGNERKLCDMFLYDI